jgi:DNA mismatch repair protein MutS2
VLLDELGAGTDPAEGAALGQAVLEHLTAQRAPTVATTHHGELKSLAVRHPAVINASMGFDVDSHQPRYDLEIGVPGRSFALEVAERLGMPHALLDRAHQLVARDEARLQELIVDLDRRRQAVLAEHQALASERQELASARDRYRQRLERVRALRDRVDAEARERARQLLAEAESVLRDARRALRQAQSSQAAGPGEGQASAQELDRVRLHLRELRARSVERQPEPPGRPLDPREIAPGKRAWAPALGEEVEILSAPNRAGRVRVQRGKFTLEVDRRQLSPIGEPAPDSTRGAASAEGGTVASGPAYGVESSEPPSLELDLRGMTGDEAVEAVERYLDRALLHDLRGVRIIHGVGTGVLRQRVQAFLREHPRVGAYRLGESGEGGAGVTVVRLTA